MQSLFILLFFLPSPPLPSLFVLHGERGWGWLGWLLKRLVLTRVDFRMPIARLLAGSAQSHALGNGDVVANDCSFSYNNAGSVV